jgi:hypothetical protein
MLKGITGALLDSTTRLFLPLLIKFYNTTCQGLNVAKKKSQETQQKFKPMETQIS